MNASASTSMASSASASTLSRQNTVDALSNRLLVVGVTANNGSNAVLSVTHCGLALTRLASQVNSAGGQRAELWYLVSPPSGTATVTVRMTQSNDVVAGATTFIGVDQAAPFGTVRLASAKSIQACVTMANEPAQLVTTVQAVSGVAGATYVGPGQILRWLRVSNASGKLGDPIGGGEVIGKGGTYQAGPVANVCSPLEASANWAVIGVPLKPAQQP